MEVGNQQMHHASSRNNIIGETAMRAAYTSGSEWLSDFLNFLDVNRAALVDYVLHDLPGITIQQPEGTYLGWLDCSGTGIQNPAKHFLDVARVALNPGAWFGQNYDSFARINFACSSDLLLSALSRIKDSLDPSRINQSPV